MENEVSKIAVVTGAARGIGLAITNKFLADGYAVALVDIDAETLADTAAELQGQPILAVECDVSDSLQVQASIEKIAAHFGRIDALVNNAGVAVFKPALETTFEDWARVLATNLNGPFLCTQACVPVMLKSGGGSVMNIASISGVRASTLRIAYGTSKAALMHLTKQQAVEYGGGDSGQCGSPRPGRNGDGGASSFGGHSHRLSRYDSVGALRHGGRNRQCCGVFVQ